VTPSLGLAPQALCLRLLRRLQNLQFAFFNLEFAMLFISSLTLLISATTRDEDLRVESAVDAERFPDYMPIFFR
jgi:hypothetical protein